MKPWQIPAPQPLPVAGASAPVRIHDTASGATREIAASGRLSMYVCGITPYDATHMGHAATYIAFDVLNRVCRDAGAEVMYVQNVTDIDDPLLERARATDVAWEELAAREISLFFDDMAALNVLPPDDYVSAVQAIPAVVRRIEELQALELVYSVEGDWYLRSGSDGQLGAVGHLSDADMRVVFAERGGDPDRPGKEHPLDCLLWMAARPGEPSWPSSLGEGRPGWHIECTTIALDRLPSPFDVQGGGRDLAFPHHDMCNVQAVALTGRALAHAFVHAGMIGLAGEKMSKSRGNLVLVSNLRSAGIDPMAIRFALLDGHYRQDRDWGDARLRSAQERLAKWRQAADAEAREALSGVRDALRQDMDTASALAILDRCADNASRAAATGAAAKEVPAVTLGHIADSLLGVRL